MFAQWRLAEVGKQAVQSLQGHGQRRCDLHTNGLSVPGVIDYEQAIRRWHCLDALLTRCVRQAQVGGKRSAFR